MDSKHNETVEGLISRLTHSKPVVRRDALREVRNLAEVDPQIVAAVRVLSATDNDSMVRKTAAATLSSLGMSPASSDELDLEPQTQSRSRATADAGLEQINLKARLCPKCGKHNPESDWACRNCGETLATNTLIDLPTPEDALEASSAPEVPTADTVQALQMLKSNNPTRRHEACEELRVAESLSPQAIEALRQATADPNEGAADAARRALAVHSPSEKQCPYCAEIIKAEAVICRYCGHDTRVPVPPPPMPVLSPSAAGGEAFVSPSPANPRKGPPSYSSNMPPEVESGPQPAEFPEEKIAPHERKPLWNSALRFGAVFAGFYVVYEIIQFSQGRIGSTEFQGNLLFGVITMVVAGTAVGFILVSLWRWQRWAPIALIILMFSGVLLYGGWVAGDISLGALSPPANMNEASEIAVTQPISTSTPVPTSTPWVLSPQPTRTSTVGAILPSGTILGRPIEDYELRGDNDGVNIGNAYFGVSGHLDTPNFAADFLANDRVAIDKAAQFFCDVAILYGLGCDVMNELYEKLEENNNVGTKALGMTLVLSQYIYQCKSEGGGGRHVGILGNICPVRNNEYRIQWVLRVAD